MERAYWFSGGGGENLHHDTLAKATAGQLTWVYINRIIDGDERDELVHDHCMKEYRTNLCPVCGKKVDKKMKLPHELSDQVYSPREYYEHQLHMTDEEKRAREIFIYEFFGRELPDRMTDG